MRDQADDGFTMAEVLVAIAVVCVVMLSLSAFFVNSIRIDTEQGDRQSAIQAADDAMERARALPPDVLLSGRDQVSSAQQWSAPIAAVAAQLAPAALAMAYDPDAAVGAGPAALLPTTYKTLVLNGILFRQYWYVGECERPAAGGACVAVAPAGGYTAFYDVIVGITWPGRSCPGVCSFVTSSLIAKPVPSEPVFDTNDSAVPPVITTATGGQTSDVGMPATLTFAASGGAPPLTWTGTSLPAGLAVDPASGAISGTPTTAGTTAAVTVTVTDAYGQKASTTFGWTVNAALGYAGFTPPASVAGRAVAPVTLTASNGTKPYAWSATGLPPGLTLDGSAGVISGTPGTRGTYAVTTRVTDAAGAVVSRTTTWTVS